MAAVHGRVAFFKVITGLLHFIAMVYLAVGNVLVPLDIVNRILSLQVHGQPFKAVGDFRTHGRKIDAAYLLEIGELRHFHAVQPHFPAKAPRPERGRFPVVFDKTDIVLFLMDAQGTQTAEIQVQHVIRGRF